MHVLERQRYLSKPIQQLTLSEVLSSLPLNHLLEIATIGVVHDDAEFAFFGFIHFSEANDVGMIEYFEDFGLLQCVSFLFFAHACYVYLLYHR